MEINPRVVSVARHSFGLPDDDGRLQVVVGDGSAYLAEGERHADVIMVDGYDAQAQAREVATQRFYRDCRQALNPGGVLVVNLWGGDRGFRACVDRISAVFGNRLLCLPAGRPGNVVVLAVRDRPARLEWRALQQRAAELEQCYELEFPRFVDELRKMNAFDAQGLLLPAENAFQSAADVKESRGQRFEGDAHD